VVNSHLLCQLSYWGSYSLRLFSAIDPVVNPACGGTLPIPLPAGLLGNIFGLCSNSRALNELA
jgi:hypothetical protein